jgi:hypothetical protein
MDTPNFLVLSIFCRLEKEKVLKTRSASVFRGKGEGKYLL